MLEGYKKKNNKRKRENVLHLGGGRVKRIELSQQLMDTQTEVQELSNRIEDTEDGLYNLRGAMSSLNKAVHKLTHRSPRPKLH